MNTKKLIEQLDYLEVKTTQGYSAYASVNKGSRQDMFDSGVRIALRKVRKLLTEQDVKKKVQSPLPKYNITEKEGRGIESASNNEGGWL